MTSELFKKHPAPGTQGKGMKLVFRLSAGFVAMLALTAFAAVPAVAAPAASAVEKVATSQSGRAGTCYIDRGGKRLYALCNSVYTIVAFRDGRVNTFGIGQDHAVYSIV